MIIESQAITPSHRKADPRADAAWDSLAQAVQGRWQQRDFLHHLVAQRNYFFIPLLFIIAGALFDELRWGWGIAGLSWLGLLYWSWHHSQQIKPTRYAALQRWDTEQQRHELTSTAYLLAHESSLSPAAAIHLEKAQAHLAQLKTAWPLEISLPSLSPLWQNLGVVALLAVGCHFLPPTFATAPPTLTAAQREALIETLSAQEQPLEEKQEEPFLSPEEKKAADALEAQFQDLQKKLGEADAAESSREALEKALAESEALARKIEKDDDLWPSDSFNESLRENPDTRSLGQAMKQKNLEAARRAADELAKRLREKNNTQEARERLRRGLEKAKSAQSAEDSKRRAPQRLSETEKKLKADQSQAASNELAELSKDFRRQSRRQEHARSLRDRQQRLRNSMENFSAERQKKPRKNSLSAEANPSSDGAKKNRQKSPLPLLSSDRKKKPNRIIPGTGKAKGKNVIPGQGLNSAKGKAAIPVPGTAAGLHPGRSPGPDPLAKKETPLPEAAQQDIVEASPENDGESQIESLLSAPNEETSETEATELTRDFLRAEEKALDDSHLPPGQRTLVKRYFDSLHQRLEK